MAFYPGQGAPPIVYLFWRKFRSGVAEPCYERQDGFTPAGNRVAAFASRKDISFGPASAVERASSGLVVFGDRPFRAAAETAVGMFNKKLGFSFFAVAHLLSLTARSALDSLNYSNLPPPHASPPEPPGSSA